MSTAAGAQGAGNAYGGQSQHGTGNAAGGSAAAAGGVATSSTDLNKIVSIVFLHCICFSYCSPSSTVLFHVGVFMLSVLPTLPP